MHNFITNFDDRLSKKLAERKNNENSDTTSCQNRPEIDMISTLERELLEDCKLKVKEQAHNYYESKIKMLMEVEDQDLDGVNKIAAEMLAKSTGICLHTIS